MNQIPEYKEDVAYSDDVRNAVRYGYQYRKEAEDSINSGIKNLSKVRLHHCLEEASDILLWIANMVLGGISWDIVKAAVQKSYRYLTNASKDLDGAESILSDEEQLRCFYRYIHEFHDKSMSINEDLANYIKEEVRADYTGKRVSEIINKYHREPNHQDWLDIIKGAKQYADELIKREQEK